jgi:hypothetical protein
MGEPDRRTRLVDVLAASAARSEDVHFDVFLPHFDFDILVHFGQHFDRGERRVAAALRVEG